MRDAAKNSAACQVGWELYSEIQSFLFFEARILDERRYSEWLELLSPDIHYWMPTIENAAGTEGAHTYSETALAYFDDDFRHLELRVKKLSDRTAWTENPPTRQCRIISNIEIFPDNSGAYSVHSTFVHHRGMGERDSFTLAGRRSDILRREQEKLRLTKRKILIDQHVLLARNLNVFF